MVVQSDIACDHDRVAAWVRAERIAYSAQKWPGDAEDRITATAWADGPDGWPFWLDQYLNRAKVLGLDTSNGRQALAKYVTVAMSMLASVERVHGPLPAPGQASGEIHAW